MLQRALLFHYAGSEIADVFDTFLEKDKSKEEEYSRATEYEEYEYEVHVFRQAKQMTGKAMYTFHTRLRKLARNCEFTDVDREVKTQIIQGCLSQRLRMTLAQRETLEYVNKTTHQRFKKINKECYRCNGIYPHVGRSCPAKGKTCNVCGKLNHFTAVYRSKQQRKHEASTCEFKKNEQSVGNQKKRPWQHSVNRIDATKEPEGSTSSEDEYVFTVSEKKQSKSEKTFNHNGHEWQRKYSIYRGHWCDCEFN